MPYGSNDGYGRQQLRDRPSTGLTSIGAQHNAGKDMQSLLSWDEGSAGVAPPTGSGSGVVWGSGQQDRTGSGSFNSRHDSSPAWGGGGGGGFGSRSGSGEGSPVFERRGAATVQAPQGASRQALLSALDQANATIRQLSQELQGSVSDQQAARCEKLETEQRELVKAVDTLSRENSSLRQKLKEQATETEALSRN